MCYTAVQMLRRNIKYAKREGKPIAFIEALQKELEELERLDLDNLYLARAFDHPKMTVLELINDEFIAKQMHWGLIPHWVKSRQEAYEIWNRTPNARGETIFEKASFRDSAQNSRCIIPINAYFEHHHKGSKTFPYLIKEKNNELMFVAGLTSKWIVPETGKEVETFSMVTTPPTEFLADIHNNPKREDSRMLMLLNLDDIETWLKGNEREVKTLIKPNFEIELAAYTTKPILGKNSIGNVPEILEVHYYQELDEQKSLFD